MCVVSMIVGTFKQYPDSWWTTEKWEQVKTTMGEAEKLDKITQQPDCHDQTKREFLEEMAKLFDKYNKETK